MAKKKTKRKTAKKRATPKRKAKKVVRRRKRGPSPLKGRKHTTRRGKVKAHTRMVAGRRRRRRRTGTISGTTGGMLMQVHKQLVG